MRLIYTNVQIVLSVFCLFDNVFCFEEKKKKHYQTNILRAFLKEAYKIVSLNYIIRGF